MLRSPLSIVLISAAFACAIAAPTDEKPSRLASSDTTLDSKQPDSPQEQPGVLVLQPALPFGESGSPEELPGTLLVQEGPDSSHDEQHHDSEGKSISTEDKSDLDTSATSHHHGYHVYYAPRWSGYYVGGHTRGYEWGHGRGYGWKAHYWY